MMLMTTSMTMTMTMNLMMAIMLVMMAMIRTGQTLQHPKPFKDPGP